MKNKLTEAKETYYAIQDFVIGVALAVVALYAGVNAHNDHALRSEYKLVVTFSAALIAVVAATQLYKHFKSVKRGK